MEEGEMVGTSTVLVGEAVVQDEREGLGVSDKLPLGEGVPLGLRLLERDREGLGVKVGDLAPELEGGTLVVPVGDLTGDELPELPPTVEVGVEESVG
jgi:hypothetical protein